MSTAKKLTEVGFRPALYCSEKIAGTLSTITDEHKDFERVTLSLPPGHNIDYNREECYQKFQAIDNALVQLKERKLRPFCLKPTLEGIMRRWDFNDLLKHLLPQVMEKGEIGLELGYTTLLGDDQEYIANF